MSSIRAFGLLAGLAGFAFAADATPISTSAGSVLVLYTGFPTGTVRQYTRTGTSVATLGLGVLGDIPESLTVLNGQLYVGDGAGHVNSINPSTGAGTTLFATPNFGLVGLGSYNGTLLAVNDTLNRVYQYSTTGALLKTIALSSMPAAANWQGLTSDNSTIYLGDFNSGIVYEYSVTGTLLGSFDTGLGAGLVVGSYDSSNNSIWVSDANTGGVYDLTTTGAALSSFATSGRAFGVAVVPPVSASPEPSSLALLFSGLAMSFAYMKFRLRKPRTCCGTGSMFRPAPSPQSR